MRKKIRLLTILVLSAVMLAGASVEAAGYAISHKSITINKGDDFQLSVTDGETKAEAVWRSLNENIVSVDQTGAITGKNTGSTTVRARYGYSYYTSKVKVVAPSIKLNKKTAVIYHGGTSVNTVQLTATVKGASRETIWESSDETVATVSNGKVISVSAGTAVITATANGVSASCIVTVKETGITLDTDSIYIGTKGNGNSWKLTTLVTGSKKNIKWTTSDKTIATVSGGKVTGKKSGTAVITAEANGVKTSCTVVVSSDISIDKEYAIIYHGGTSKNTIQLKTNAPKGTTLTWTSSNPETATVENGLVTSVSEGETTITVNDGIHSHSCIITVEETAISLDQEEILLKTKGNDKIYKLAAAVTGSSKKIRWTTSDKKVATVSGGKVTAKKAGTAVITAEANGVKTSCAVTVADYDPTISISKEEYVLYTGNKGNTVKLTAKANGPVKAVTWSSSNEDIAIVVNGKVTSVQEGTAVITASANDVSASCEITVKNSTVNLSESSLKLDKKEKAQLTADVTGYSQTVTWKSSNPSVASVSNGIITTKKNGTAVITASANGIATTCEIVVDHKKPVAAVKKEATCEEDGLIQHVCSGCGELVREEVIPALDHEWELIETIAPGCGYEYVEEDYGYTLYQCSRCEAEKEENIVPARVHQWEKTKTVDPECEKDGYILYTCTFCEEENREVLEAAGHSWDEGTVVAPKCGDELLEENKGYTLYTCTKCEQTKKENITEALIHEWEDAKVLVPAGCETTGTMLKKCIHCGKEKEVEIPAIGHDYSIEAEVLKEADCFNTGLVKKECSHCHDLKEFETPVLKHIWDTKLTYEAPGCDHDGYKGYRCTRKCGSIRLVESFPTLGHDWSEYTTVKPTCEDWGYDYRTCSRCELKEKKNWVNSLDHNWVLDYVEGQYCHERIINHYKCTRCEATNAELVRMPIKSNIVLAHNWDQDSIVKEDVLQEGETDPCTGKWVHHDKRTCLDCGYIHETWETPTWGEYRGHMYGEYQIVKEPTAYTNFYGDSVNYDFGIAEMICPECGERLMEDKVFNVILIDLGDGKTDTIIGYFDEEAYKNYELVKEYRYGLGLESLEIDAFDRLDDFYWNSLFSRFGTTVSFSDWKPEEYEVEADFLYNKYYTQENYMIEPYDLYDWACLRVAEAAYRSITQGENDHNRPNGQTFFLGENLIFCNGRHDTTAQWAFDCWYNSPMHEVQMSSEWNGSMAAAKFSIILKGYNDIMPQTTGEYWIQSFIGGHSDGTINEKERYFNAYGAEKFNKKYGTGSTVSGGDAE